MKSVNVKTAVSLKNKTALSNQGGFLMPSRISRKTALIQSHQSQTAVNRVDLKRIYSYLSDLLLVNEGSEERPACPHCKSSLVIKYGIKRGKQRYRCRGCQKTFVATTNTVMYHSHFDKTTWLEFIKDTVEGRSILLIVSVFLILPPLS